MKFRPCIDIHNGAVKQIVGKSLSDEKGSADENFVSDKDAACYARRYQKDGLSGGHIILLNKAGTDGYKADTVQAVKALNACPGILQIGGGITPENAPYFLEQGASHVIVTSYVFKDGKIHTDRLKSLSQAVGRKHLVLDLSCKKRGGVYYVMTDRWQHFTDVPVTKETLLALADYCDEFLIHAVDVEGCRNGIETDLIPILRSCAGIPMTYAGGIASMSDIALLDRLGNGQLDFTVGSALDLFGGSLSYSELAAKFS